jgi:hypothetical protein
MSEDIVFGDDTSIDVEAETIEEEVVETEAPKSFIERVMGSFDTDNNNENADIGKTFSNMVKQITQVFEDAPPNESGADQLNRIGNAFGSFGTSLGIEIDQQMFAHFKTCLETMDMQAALEDTQQHFQLPDEYEINIEMSVKIGSRSRKATEPTVD